MEMSDLAAISYASQLLAYALLCALFLRRRRDTPFSRYLGAAAAASSLMGGVLTLQALDVIAFGTVVVVAEWAKNILWIIALFMVLRALDSRRLAEKIARRYVLPALIIALAGLFIYVAGQLDLIAVSLLIGGVGPFNHKMTTCYYIE